MHGLPVRIYRARLPYLDAYQLRRKKITPPSSPGVGTARHHSLAAWVVASQHQRPLSAEHILKPVYVEAGRPTGFRSQGI